MDRETQDRRRIEELAMATDRDPPSIANGSEVEVVKTKLKTTYPTVAARYYYCEVQRVGGTPTEGSTGTLTAVGRFLTAFNLGTQVPPAGTTLRAIFAGNRWTIRYNG